jgi:hypothetical protein
MIKNIIEKAKELNLTSIRANIPGFKKPDLINGYMPDLVVWQTYWMYIYIVVTAETFNDPKITSQITSFSKYASENFERLVVLIPKGIKELTQQKLKEININECMIVEIE